MPNWQLEAFACNKITFLSCEIKVEIGIDAALGVSPIYETWQRR